MTIGRHPLINVGLGGGTWGPHSNYFGTELSTISTLNMRYLNFLTEEKDGYQEFPPPERMYEENIVMQNFKSAGYKIILIHKALTSQS